MSKKTTKRGSRSRRNPAKDYKGEVSQLANDGNRVTMQLSLPIAELLAGVHGAVEEMAGEAGLLIMQSLIEEEVEQRAGQRYKHDPQREAMRWGKEESHVTFGGKKVPFLRPRLRGAKGQEVQLDRFKLFQRGSAMEEAVAKQVICGVSMRDYEKAVDGLCDGYGVRKSSVSRQWKAISQARLAEFAERSLEDLDLVAILIDGLTFQEALLVVALGVDSEGRKHVLGLWEGATENGEVVKSLLEDLVRRGVGTEKRYLFVLDGAKALHSAVRKVFGTETEIQRCHVHKERNVLEHLPKGYHQTVRMRLRAAWKMKDYEEANSELLRLERYLKDLNPSAARSLAEGMEETLTLHRLEIPDSLRKSLRTTNAIESCFDMTRKYCRNVKRWRKGNMTTRWAGTMLMEAQKRFRRVKGFRAMAKLFVALGRPLVDADKAIG